MVKWLFQSSWFPSRTIYYYWVSQVDEDEMMGKKGFFFTKVTIGKGDDKEDKGWQRELKRWTCKLGFFLASKLMEIKLKSKHLNDSKRHFW